MSKSSRHPVLLMILDGFGEAKPADDNAITRAEPKFYYKMRDRGLLGFLDASGTCVGLPEGQMGNSEVGHLSIGAGRTVRQDLTRINLSIDKGEFQKKPALVAAFDRVGTGGGARPPVGPRVRRWGAQQRSPPCGDLAGVGQA